MNDKNCAVCNGKGALICPGCDGRGKAGNIKGYEACARCGGKGLITCPKCNGSGKA